MGGGDGNGCPLSPLPIAGAGGGARLSHFAILLAGPCEPTPALRAAVGGARAIAADAGMRHAAALDLTPESWVGDFDGASPALLHAYRDTPRDEHPPAKDATDGEIALRAALARGATRLTLVGALGGPRLDHALGTLALGLATAERGAAVAMTDGRQWAHPVLPGRPLAFTVDGVGPLVSVIGLSDLAGLTLTGVRWPLVDADVPLGSSLTLSNEMAGGADATASLRAGRAWLVRGPGDGRSTRGTGT